MSEQAEVLLQSNDLPSTIEEVVAVPLLSLTPTHPQEERKAQEERKEILRVLEAALLTTQEPLSLVELKNLFDMPLENSLIEALLQQLEQQYAHSGVELNRVAQGDRKSVV